VNEGACGSFVAERAEAFARSNWWRSQLLDLLEAPLRA
jgi:hypothetical protein